MKLRLLGLAGAAIALVGLGACAVDEAYYGPPSPYADVDYDGFYDGYYGPFVGGYWGAGDRFYYWDRNHGHYHRDVGGHFARQGRPGFNAIRGQADTGNPGKAHHKDRSHPGGKSARMGRGSDADDHETELHR